MFFCFPGGGRKHRTKEDLVDAAVGFEAGTTSDRIASHRGQDGVSVISSTANSVDRAQVELAERMTARSAPVHAPGHASGQATPLGYQPRPTTAAVQAHPPPLQQRGPPPQQRGAPPQQSPPPPQQTGDRFASDDRGRPTPSQEGSVAPAPAPDQIAPLPNSIFTRRKNSDWLNRPRNLSSFDDGHDGVAVARDRLANVAGSWPVGVEFGPEDKGGRERLEDERSMRPGDWINPTESVMEKESVRPGWIDKTDSIADRDVVKHVWVDAPGSVDVDVQRSQWPRGSGGETPQSVRPGWIDQSGSVLAPSARPDWEGEDKSSEITPSVRPGWMGESGPEISPSVLRDGRNDDRSVLAPSERPGWIDHQGYEISPSVIPSARDGGGESVGFRSPQQKPFWTAREDSEAGDSVRPGWMEGAVRTVGGVYRMDDDDTRSRRPTWMAADGDSSVIDPSVISGHVLHPPGQVAPSPRSHGDRRDPMGSAGRPAGRSSNSKPTPVKFGRDAQSDVMGEGALSPTSPVGTIAGQCTSQDAERHKSELQDPVEVQPKPAKQLEPEAGGLLQLLDLTDKQETERRRIEKKSNERPRRHPKSLHDTRGRNEVEKVFRQQSPQQGSAEEPAKIVTVRRSETMPAVRDGSHTVAGVSRKDKRPTPSSIPPHRASPSQAYASSGLKHMSPSGAADRGSSPHTPMTAHGSSGGSYTSSPSPRGPVPVTNPYGGSSPHHTAVNSPGFSAQGGKGDRSGRSPGMRGAKMAATTARKSTSPVVMASATSPATVRGSSPVMVRGHVHGVSGGVAAVGGGVKAGQGTPPHGAGKHGGLRGRDGASVRFMGVGSSSSEKSSAAGNRDLNPQDFPARASHMSPSRAPGSITEPVSATPASPKVKIATTPPDRRRSSNSNSGGGGGGSGSKPKNSAGASLTSRILPFSIDMRSRMSSGSSSTSSGDGRKNSDGTPRREREQAGRAGEGGGEQHNPRSRNGDPVGSAKKPKSSRPRSPGGMSRVEQATGPPPNGGGSVKMWQSRDETRDAPVTVAAPAGAGAAAGSVSLPPAAGGGGKGSKGFCRSILGSQSRLVQATWSPQRRGRGQAQGQGSEAGGRGGGQAGLKVEVSPLIKTPQWSLRPRQQSRPGRGTPGQRNLSRSRVRNPSDLASVNEEPINASASPLKIFSGRRRNSTGSDTTSRDGSSDATGPSRSEHDFDKHHDKPDVGQRPAVSKPPQEPQHVAPTAPHAEVIDGKFALNNPSPVTTTTTSAINTTTPDITTDAITTDAAAELEGATPRTRQDLPTGVSSTGEEWLRERSKRPTFLLPFRDDSFRRPQRMSRSSSVDDGSGGSFGPRAMFSPDRFNAFAGALSRRGSVDDSLCDSSVRSFVTTGTRNSSSSLVSARGLSDRKLIAPQLSNSEKQTVARLKIKRVDVHFGYNTVRGSARVYKAELNGEVCAAKVLNILGMTKDAQSDVFETFDAELLALSQLNTTNIVKVHGASVSSAEIVVVSEFVEGGVLRDLLNNRSKQRVLTDRVRLVIAMDVAAGMKSLYAHGMQHRKLTSSAILLTGDYRAKIIGVGLSMTTEMIAFFQGKEGEEEQQEQETLPWASREVLAGAGFSEKSDVYSFGIILWEMMQKDGSKPYAGLTSSEVVGAKYNGEGPAISPHCAPEIRNLMESCWSNLPADRPSFDKICDILGAISLDRGDKNKSAPTSRMAGGSQGTSADAMSRP